MKKKLLTTSLTALVVLGAAGAAAAAGPPYTVKVGSHASGTYASSAKARSAGSTFLRVSGPSNALDISCTGLSASGSITAGTLRNPVQSFTSTTWTGCASGFGRFTVSQTRPWAIRGTGSNATTGLEDVVGVAESYQVSFRLTNNPSLCSFTISGAPRLTLREATTPQRVEILDASTPAGVVVSDSNGCLGRAENGRAAQFTTSLDLTTDAGPINLS